MQIRFKDGDEKDLIKRSHLGPKDLFQKYENEQLAKKEIERLGR